jgi:hypothetical protein
VETVNEHLVKRRNAQIEAAKRYAASDKSDPFTLNRALAHIRNGIVGFQVDKNGKPTEQRAWYDAEKHQETRKLPEGSTFSDGTNEWVVDAYKNVQHP